MADIAEGLQNYAYDHQEHLVAGLMSIGFGGVANSPIKPLTDFAQMIQTSGRIVLTDLIMGDPWQPGGTDEFSPKNNVAGFKTREAQVEPAKVDLLFKHSKIRAFYNTYISRVKTQEFDPETFPFEAYLIEKLQESMQKHLRLTAWKGVKDVADKSATGMFDGWRKQLLDVIANNPTDINVIDIALLTQSNAVEQLELVARDLPDEIVYSENAVMILDGTSFRKYNENYRDRFGNLRYNNTFEKMTLDGTNVEIIVEQGVAGFERPLVTTRENLIMLYDDAPTNTSISFDHQPRDRSLAYLFDGMYGAGIAATELIWLGDGA